MKVCSILDTWEAAMNGNYTERAQGVCPAGWHIPSECESRVFLKSNDLSLSNLMLYYSIPLHVGSVSARVPAGEFTPKLNRFQLRGVLHSRMISSRTISNRGAIVLYIESYSSSDEINFDEIFAPETGSVQCLMH